ncbi:hypothetical protein [Sulfurimonas sp.]|uniref:hypothetical protein n=1 Tax=Sulfurimonas sp. TaxID=2022749 RepID=UPI002AAF1959|nr:hypothetical protein [Sulfurimonas sp.]
MIIIEYVNEYLEGEPPPNFLWRGKVLDFLQLVKDLHVLGVSNGQNILLNEFNYISIEDDMQIELYSNKDKKILNKKEDKTIIIDLDKKLWREIIVQFLHISFEESHDYVDLDEYVVLEDANFIISSDINN